MWLFLWVLIWFPLFSAHSGGKFSEIIFSLVIFSRDTNSKFLVLLDDANSAADHDWSSKFAFTSQQGAPTTWRNNHLEKSLNQRQNVVPYRSDEEDRGHYITPYYKTVQVFRVFSCQGGLEVKVQGKD